MTPVSLQRRLIAILLGLTVAVWLLSVTLTAASARKVVDQQIEAQLALSVDLAQHTLEAVLEEPLVGKYFSRRGVTRSSTDARTRMSVFKGGGNRHAINLWFGKRHVLVGEDTPAFPRPDREGVETVPLASADGESYWRLLYRYHPTLDVWIAAGVNLDHAQRLGRSAFWQALLPLLIILPATTAILIVGVRSGLRPLNELAEKIAERKPLDHAPIELTAVPAEIRPVVVALNGLLDRLQRALASEQRFTANAAHELQTPLAAIKAEVQRCQREVKDGTARLMLERISTRVTRAANTVTQLLTLARLDPDQEFTREPVDLARLIAEVMADLGGLAVDRRLTMRLDVPDEAFVVAGHKEWLGIMLRNLLLNALQHSEPLGEIEVSLKRANGQVALAIANDCDPIAETDFLRLPERFYRPSSSTTPGVGLGLSIAHRIADLHGVELRLQKWKSERGFLATVVFPPEHLATA